jgi:hypothetical protein
MRISIRPLCFPALLMALACAPLLAANQNLPACNTQVLARHGRNVRIQLDALTRQLNDELNRAHSHFSDLQLSTQGNQVKVSGKKAGSSISIQGPLTVTSDGQLRLHAKQIHKNGVGEEGLMSLFGRDLADYVNLKKTKSMRVSGDNLKISTDKLLGLHAHATKVQVHAKSIAIRFASQPCQ